MEGKLLILFVLLPVLAFNSASAAKSPRESAAIEKFFPADNRDIRYTGRIDFSNLQKPRFWQPGVYIEARFKGNYCQFIVNDENIGGINQNYLEVVIDDSLLYRVETKGKTDTIRVAEGLAKGDHSITICKNTEAGNGYLEFVGFLCQGLLPLYAHPLRKLEFIGNSITCGAGSDLSEISCGKGQWYDQHNAYLSYGPRTARMLYAQWQLSSVSGIGLIHSCCRMSITMPDVYEKVDMRGDSIAWDFNKYQPDAVTICLGQNDGIQDSVKFCGAYVKFIKQIRDLYPNATIICLTSPMADSILTRVLKNYLDGIVGFLNEEGDQKVYRFFFSKRYHQGCGGHPDLAEHKMIALELSAYLKSVLHW